MQKMQRKEKAYWGTMTRKERRAVTATFSGAAAGTVAGYIVNGPTGASIGFLVGGVLAGTFNNIALTPILRYALNRPRKPRKGPNP